MKKVKFTILPHAFMEQDLCTNVSMSFFGNIHDKTPKAKWVKSPLYSILIHHEDIGWILYDTGWNKADLADRYPDYFKENFPLMGTEDDYITNQLKKAGLTPDDISLLIISHSHWDHMGGIDAFSNTKAGKAVLTTGTDYLHGAGLSHATSENFDGGYFRGNYDFPGLDFKFVDKDYKINDEIELITLPGHTPMVLGMVLHTPAKTYIFPSDACGMKLNYGPPVRFPGYIYDSLSYVKSIERIRELQEKYDAEIIFSHDWDLFETYKKVPEFYE